MGDAWRHEIPEMALLTIFSNLDGSASGERAHILEGEPLSGNQRTVGTRTGTMGRLGQPTAGQVAVSSDRPQK